MLGFLSYPILAHWKKKINIFFYYFFFQLYIALHISIRGWGAFLEGALLEGADLEGAQIKQNRLPNLSHIEFFCVFYQYTQPLGVVYLHVIRSMRFSVW